AGPAAGCAAYLAWNHRAFGAALGPFTIQQRGNFRGEVANPLSVLWSALGGAFDWSRHANGPHLPWVVVAIVVVAVAARRWPLPYGAFAIATLAVALSTERLGSFERYTLTTVPVALALATIARAPARQRALFGAGVAGVTLYSTLSLVGGYVP
ncbi:MAG: hypothetical protein ACRD0D_13425, partial [Acidimicrobiales bacterium]